MVCRILVFMWSLGPVYAVNCGGLCIITNNPIPFPNKGALFYGMFIVTAGGGILLRGSEYSNYGLRFFLCNVNVTIIPPPKD